MNQGSGKERLRSRAVFAAHCLTILLYCTRPISAQQLPFRHYGISDGLAGARVTAICQDAKGYLWFGTWDGLSRYDGYRFQNYGLSDGIAHLTINAIVRDRRDRLWVATNGGGVARLIDEADGAVSAQKKFLSQRIGDSIYSNRVNAMLFDTQNTLWLATDLGVYRGHEEANGRLRFEHVLPYPPTANAMTALADSHERLWFGVIRELYRFAGDRITKYDARDGVARHYLRALSEDRQGRLLAASDFEVFEFIPGAAANDRGQWRRLPIELAAGQEIRALAADATGALWIGTTTGLIKYFDRRQTFYTTAHGLRDDHIRALLEDREGNLWIGAWSGGVSKLPRLQPVSFTKQEGIVEQNIVRVMEDRQGRIYAMSDRSALFEIADGKAKLIPNSARPPFGTKVNTQLTQYLQDRRGDWWVGALDGLYHFPGSRLQLRRGRKLGLDQGIPKGFEIQGHVSGLYEDPAGNIWVAASKLYRLDAAHLSRPFFHALSLPDQVGKERLFAMMKDRAGALWLAWYNALARLNNGKITFLQPSAGLPETRARAFFQDSRGRLWIGLRYQGLSMTADPQAAHPNFVNYTSASGLPSDSVLSVTEDNQGRIYAATSRGLAQLDPDTGRIRRFTSADGLAGDIVNHCLRDQQGNIWSATSRGVSRLNPAAESALKAPPPIYLSRVQAAGEERLPIGMSTARLSGLNLSPTQNNLLIEYVGPTFSDEGALKYQYKLEGIDADWSKPHTERAVNYARLAPGAYRFLVRAVDRDGLTSLEPAVLEFQIRPPIFRQWWFLTLASLVTIAVCYAAYRYRVARLIELERVRMRIATDLHDDIGSNLSQIALLSEALRRELKYPDQQADERLSAIARTSRELIDVVSDIVWAVNPRRDRLRDLTQRMRRYAEDTLGARDIQLHFQTSGADADRKLGVETRRELFLIFKESINNIARHAQCTKVDVVFHTAGKQTFLKICDNGQGFNTRGAYNGQGLVSLKERAERLGGRLEVTSVAGAGTTVILCAPTTRRKSTR